MAGAGRKIAPEFLPTWVMPQTLPESGAYLTPTLPHPYFLPCSTSPSISLVPWYFLQTLSQYYKDC
jgi:hypothetical protein